MSNFEARQFIKETDRFLLRFPILNFCGCSNKKIESQAELFKRIHLYFQHVYRQRCVCVGINSISSHSFARLV